MTTDDVINQNELPFLALHFLFDDLHMMTSDDVIIATFFPYVEAEVLVTSVHGVEHLRQLIVHSLAVSVHHHVDQRDDLVRR